MRERKNVKKRSVTISGHSTSVSLENEFWNALENIATKSDISIAALITEIDNNRPDSHNLSSAIRVYILKHIQESQ